jgi:hypothetical protein
MKLYGHTLLRVPGRCTIASIEEHACAPMVPARAKTCILMQANGVCLAARIVFKFPLLSLFALHELEYYCHVYNDALAVRSAVLLSRLMHTPSEFHECNWAYTSARAKKNRKLLIVCNQWPDEKGSTCGALFVWPRSYGRHVERHVELEFVEAEVVGSRQNWLIIIISKLIILGVFVVKETLCGIKIWRHRERNTPELSLYVETKIRSSKTPTVSNDVRQILAQSLSSSADQHSKHMGNQISAVYMFGTICTTDCTDVVQSVQHR